MGETGFRVERSTNGGAYSSVGTVGPNITSFPDTVSPWNSYSYRVVALGTTTESSASSPVSVDTYAGDRFETYAAQDPAPTMNDGFGWGSAWTYQDPPPFAISDISGLVIWFPVDQITGKSEGDLVDSFLDQSGNSRNLTATGTQRPTYKANLVNGYPALRYDGGDFLSRSDSGFPTADFSIVYVIRANIDYPNGSYAWLGGWGTSSTNQLVVPYIGGVNIYGGNSVFGLTQSGDSGPDWGGPSSCYNVWSVGLITRTGNSWKFYRNSYITEKSKTMTTNTVLGGTFRMGGWPPASGYLTGDIAEHAVWNKVLSLSERTQLMNGLGAKYGITIS